MNETYFSINFYDFTIFFSDHERIVRDERLKIELNQLAKSNCTSNCRVIVFFTFHSILETVALVPIKTAHQLVA